MPLGERCEGRWELDFGLCDFFIGFEFSPCTCITFPKKFYKGWRRRERRENVYSLPSNNERI